MTPLFINLNNVTLSEEYIALREALKQGRPRDSALTHAPSGNQGRIFYTFVLPQNILLKLKMFITQACLHNDDMNKLFQSHESWYVSDKAHLIAEYFSPVMPHKPMQKWHRDTSYAETLYSLFINVNDDNLNTHFRNDTTTQTANTPVLLYDAHEEHAGPSRSIVTQVPTYVKDRFQIFLSPSSSNLVNACRENGVKHAQPICMNHITQ